DGIRDKLVTGVQTCALPISAYDETRQRASALIGEEQAQRAIESLAVVFRQDRRITALAHAAKYARANSGSRKFVVRSCSSIRMRKRFTQALVNYLNTKV